MILIVDDNAPLGKLYRTVLKNEGFQAEVIQAAKDALKYLESNPLPKLLFLDCSMPQMDGEEFLNELEKIIPDYSSLMKVIGFSSYEKTAPIVQTFLTRVFRYAEKPSDTETFMKLVRSSLESL